MTDDDREFIQSWERVALENPGFAFNDAYTAVARFTSIVKKLEKEVSYFRDESNKFFERIGLLEKEQWKLLMTYRHYHKAAPDSIDRCNECALDLRHPIHIRGA